MCAFRGHAKAIGIPLRTLVKINSPVSDTIILALALTLRFAWEPSKFWRLLEDNSRLWPDTWFLLKNSKAQQGLRYPPSFPFLDFLMLIFSVEISTFMKFEHAMLLKSNFRPPRLHGCRICRWLRFWLQKPRVIQYHNLEWPPKNVKMCRFSVFVSKAA